MTLAKCFSCRGAGVDSDRAVCLWCGGAGHSKTDAESARLEMTRTVVAQAVATLRRIDEAVDRVSRAIVARCER